MIENLGYWKENFSFQLEKRPEISGLFPKNVIIFVKTKHFGGNEYDFFGPSIMTTGLEDSGHCYYEQPYKMI